MWGLSILFLAMFFIMSSNSPLYSEFVNIFGNSIKIYQSLFGFFSLILLLVAYYQNELESHPKKIAQLRFFNLVAYIAWLLSSLALYSLFLYRFGFPIGLVVSILILFPLFISILQYTKKMIKTIELHYEKNQKKKKR
jgi:hypothetical protein